MASPVWQSQTLLAIAGAQASAVVTLPTGIVADDVVLVSIYKENNAAITPPAGYTQKSVVNSTGTWHYLFWHRASGSESGTVTFSWTGSTFRSAGAHRVSGCITSGDPIELVSTNFNNTASSTSPAVSLTASADSLLYWAATTLGGSAAWTEPSGFTERISTSDPITGATKANAAGGASGSVTGTSGVSDQMTAILASLISSSTPAETSGVHPVFVMQRRGPAFPGPFLQAPLTYWPEPPVSVAPSVRSSATYASAASETTGTVPLPAGWQVGDIIYIGWELTATTGTVTVPGGWTAVVPQFRPAGVTNAAHGVLRRVAQAGDTDVALTYTSGRFAAVSVAVQGADTTTPEDVTPTTDDNTSAAAYPNVNAPSITPVTNNCLLLTVHTFRNGTNGATSSFAPPSGMAEVNDVASAVAASSNAAVEVASLALSGTSATGQKTATATSSSGTLINQMGSTIAVRPAVGGGSGLTGSADVAPVSTITATGSASGSAAVAETVAITATGNLAASGSASVAPSVAITATGALTVGVLKTNTAEGGTNTTTVTTGNSGGASGDAFDAVNVGASNAITFTSSSPWNGSLSYSFVKASTNQNYVGWTWTGAQADFAFLIGFRFPAGNLAQDEPIIRLFSGTGYTPQIAGLQLLAGATRKIRVSDTGTAVNVDSTASLALNTDYVAVGRWISGTSLTVDVYAKGSLTVAATATVTASAGSVNSVRIGLTGSLNSAVTLIADDLGIGFGAPLARTDLGGFSGSADVAEAVALTATGTGSGSAAVSETVALAATGAAVGSAAVSPSVAITATGVLTLTGTAAVAPTVALASTGAAVGSAARAETVTIAATGNMSAFGTAAVAEVATIAATGSGVGSAAVSSSVAITATGIVTLAGTAAVAETVTLAATGTASGSAAVSESVAITATAAGVGSAARSVSVTISATGALTFTGTAAVAETVGIASAGASAGSAAVSESVALAATGSGVGTAAVAESVAITATGTIVTGLNGTAAVSETVTIAATGNLAASGTAAVSETVNRTATGTTSGTAAVAPSVTISATGAITWTGTASRPETVTVASTGAAVGSSQRSETVALAATGAAQGAANASVAVTITATGLLSGAGIYTTGYASPGSALLGATALAGTQPPGPVGVGGTAPRGELALAGTSSGPTAGAGTATTGPQAGRGT